MELGESEGVANQSGAVAVGEFGSVGGAELGETELKSVWSSCSWGVRGQKRKGNRTELKSVRSVGGAELGDGARSSESGKGKRGPVDGEETPSEQSSGRS